MRALIAALAITFTVAIAASVVATWASVADAPWEDSVPVVQPVDRTQEIRCEGALNYRNAIIEAGPARRDLGGIFYERTGNPAGVEDYDGELAKADREIDRYC